MSCYHPLLRVAYHPLGHVSDTRVKVLSYSDTIVSDFYKLGFAVDEAIQIPCGKCIGCRLEYSRQWANRCMLELEYHDSAYFVTLTYDDDHVPISWYVDDTTGETCPAMSLRKRDMQLWMKRLRKACGSQRIRFYLAGEYGSQTFRPHYHAILFGLELHDLSLYAKKSDEFSYFNSLFLDKTWIGCYNGITKCKGSATTLTQNGHVVVAPVSWDTCAYVARYVTKKLTGPAAKLYDDCNIEHPFTLMSRKPGIGRQWYEDHPDCYDYEYINISTDRGGKKFRPPRYFDKLFDLDEPERSKELKEARRRAADDAKRLKMANTSLSYLELLQVEENSKLNKIKKLERSLE
uniref:Replication initiator protein n=1 Tax=Dulem virus 174 TaxID=3145651 RepID=A0AAU8B635_9VIRU